jgi:hypothetical protein
MKSSFFGWDLDRQSCFEGKSAAVRPLSAVDAHRQWQFIVWKSERAGVLQNGGSELIVRRRNEQ